MRELGDIILEAGVWSIAKAVSRKDWDALIQGDWRRAWGDVEGCCVRTCYSEATKLAQALYPEGSSVALFFDDRPGRNAEVKKLFDIYRLANQVNKQLSLDSISFVKSAKFLPLQPADLIAWEQYHCALDWLWAAIVTTESGERMLLSFRQAVAGQIFGQIGAAMRRMTQEGKQVQIQSIPERVMAYNAVSMGTDEGQLVEILVQGDQSRHAFHGVMQPIAARSFAALLSGSAESSEPKLAN